MEFPKNEESKIVKNIFLWSAPRCLTTAFSCAIMNLKGGKCLAESYADAYHFGSQRKSDRYPNDPVKPNATFEEQGLREYKHSFLIRNPNKSIPSLYRVATNTEVSGWDHFNPVEAGFRQLLELYEFVVKEFDSSPVIIDADDLLESPEEMMKKYCEATGLIYEENMTTWEIGSAPELGAASSFNGWREVVIRSTGLGKVPKKRTEDHPIKASDEKEVNDSINDSLRYYKVLYEKRLKLPSKQTKAQS
ncbi:Hypothetical predicted protein [Paramuricea clavata]|uniref:Uncharacterized protein n=1 Tax=Paramuricea clavata TaxID=317549 RepID=A0A7D9HH05_PARCT|nr:Hypothetical predicted protein [Paramuricea clavata]